MEQNPWKEVWNHFTCFHPLCPHWINAAKRVLEAVKEVPFIAQIPLFMGTEVELPTKARINNVDAMFMSENVSSTPRTRHIWEVCCGNSYVIYYRKWLDCSRVQLHPWWSWSSRISSESKFTFSSWGSVIEIDVFPQKFNSISAQRHRWELRLQHEL